MKSLIILNGKDAPRSHKLAELAALLPNSDLDPVRTEYGKRIQEPSFDKLLSEVSDFFVKLRYGYEFDIFSLNEHSVYVLANAMYIHTAGRNKQQPSVSGVRV